jgi:membrane protein
VSTLIQKIIVILICAVIILARSIGKGKINRKMMFFLSSVIVLSSILLIIKQLANQEVIFFSFLDIVGGEFAEMKIILSLSKLIFEIIISVILLNKISGEAKFRQDLSIFFVSIISSQIIFTDFPNLISLISQKISTPFFVEIIFNFLYLLILAVSCQSPKKQDTE